MTEIVCPFCGHSQLELAMHYAKPPLGETQFDIDDYSREYHRCPICSHYLGVTKIDLTSLYSGDYVDATYSSKGIADTFSRIMALPPERSDNSQRVARITKVFGNQAGSLLDVGSGLGVFPARMKSERWDVVALDPDPRAVAFLTDHVDVRAVCADFMNFDNADRYDLITFNKVLEHVANPVEMLKHCRSHLAAGGKVYVELPDGEAAALDPDGFSREEFFIEHIHVFSGSSFALLASRAGFRVDRLERIREPSGKYTLFGFLSQ